MKRLLRIMLVLLPFVAVNTFAAQANPPSKQNVHKMKNNTEKKPNVKKSDGKVAGAKKAVAKNSVKKKTDQKELKNKKAAVKPVEKNTKKVTNKSASASHSSTKSSAHKMAKKADNHKIKPKATTHSVKPKAEKTETVSQAPKAEPKLVVVPQCQESQVFQVLADAFKQQGNATGTPMMVKHILQARETQHYPQQGIRSCHALVETNGKKYQTDYSVILSGNRFFVQVENAQAAF